MLNHNRLDARKWQASVRNGCFMKYARKANVTTHIWKNNKRQFNQHECVCDGEYFPTSTPFTSVDCEKNNDGFACIHHTQVHTYFLLPSPTRPTLEHRVFYPYFQLVILSLQVAHAAHAWLLTTMLSGMGNTLNFGHEYWVRWAPLHHFISSSSVRLNFSQFCISARVWCLHHFKCFHPLNNRNNNSSSNETVDFVRFGMSTFPFHILRDFSFRWSCWARSIWIFVRNAH